jgi:hypothetical protein
MKTITDSVVFTLLIIIAIRLLSIVVHSELKPTSPNCPSLDSSPSFSSRVELIAE